MTFATYEAQTCLTWSGTERFKRSVLGLFEETGELVGKIKKYHRGDEINLAEEIGKEAGDCYYYATRIVAESGLLKKFPKDIFNTDYDCNEEDLLDKLVTLSAHIMTFRNKQNTFVNRYSLKVVVIAYIVTLNSFVEWYNHNPVDILINNGAKLADRKKRGVLKGNGDDR